MSQTEDNWLGAIAETAGDLCWVASRDLSRVHYVSPAFQRLSEAHEPTDARSFHHMVHPTDRSRIEQNHQGHDGSFEHDYRLVTPEGATRWVRERVSAAVVVAQDITELKQAAEDRDKILERFRIMSRAMNEGMWDWDIASNLAWYSDAMYTVFGMDPAVPTTVEAWGERVHPADRERVVAGFRRVVESGEQTWSDEYRFVRPDGRVLEIFDRGFVMFDDAQRPVRMVGVVMDITQQRALERQLQHAQKMEAVGQLAGGIAHDFNNMLQAAQLELALLKRATTAVPDALAHVTEVRAALDRAASLTRQLLVFSRFEAMQLQTIDLNAQVMELARMLRRVLGERVSLEIDLAERAIPVEADPSMLDQVLINLAVNARDAMRGDGKLSISTTVCEQLDRPGGSRGRYVRISVTDTGIGIAPDIRSRIFEPFFTTKESTGTGLGLATAHGIIEKHRGWIEVDSETGRGATFHVHLPVQDVAVVPRAEPLPVAQSRGRERILVVEDDEAVRRAVSGWLAGHGYTVTEADSGAAALAAWEACDGAIDLVYTDLVMPGGIDGAELAALLAARRPDVKVIVATGYGELAPDSSGRGYELLRKPVDAERLLGSVRAYLDG